MKLAITAALEHYTATMAETLLSEPELQARFADQGLFRMWAWHAIEECEHKSVAFDVYKAVGGDEEMRRRALRMSTLALVFIAGWHTVAGVLTDRRSWRRFGLVRSLWRMRTEPAALPRLPAADRRLQPPRLPPAPARHQRARVGVAGVARQRRCTARGARRRRLMRGMARRSTGFRRGGPRLHDRRLPPRRRRAARRPGQLAAGPERTGIAIGADWSTWH